MLSNPKRIDSAFLERRLLPIWKDVLRRRHSLPADVVLLPHLRTYIRELRQAGFPARHRDEPVVASARSVLRKNPEGDAALARVIAEAQKRLQPFELRDALDGQVQTVILSSTAVPGCYTRAGFRQFVRRELEEAHGQIDREAWVLSDGGDGGDFNDGLRARYFEEYSAAWKKFLRGLSVRVSSTSNPRDSLRDLEILTQENPPYVRLLRNVVQQTSITEEEDLRSELSGALDRLEQKKINEVKGKVLGGSPDAGVPGLHIVAPLEVDFAKVRSFSNKIGRGQQDPPVVQYLAQLARVRDALRQISEAGGSDALRLGEEIRGADELTSRLLLDTMDEHTRPLLRNLLEQPLHHATITVHASTGDEMSQSWREGVFTPFQRGLLGRYPFSRQGSDATLADTTDFLREGGVLWSYYQDKLAKYVVRSGEHFHPDKPYQKVFGAGLLGCLQTGWIWTSSLFPPGAQAPQVQFEAQTQPVGREISEVRLEIDGQVHSYRNGPAERWPLKWPGEKVHGVKLAVYGKAGPIETLTFPGEWGLLHFFDAGKVIGTKGGVYQMVWELKTGAQVQLDFKPARSSNPLSRRPSMSCPTRVR
jgi:type VI secretion system protein ImpL